MEIKPIDIDIEDDRHYTLIAFLVDQPLFLKGVQDIRIKFKFIIPFEIISEKNDHLKDHFIKLAGYNPKEFYKLQAESNPLKGFNFDTPSDIDDSLFSKYQKFENKVGNIQKAFYEELRILRMKFHYPRIFQYVVQSAVLENKISSFSSASAFADEIPYYPFQADGIMADRELVMGIELMPYATKKDVLSAFEDFKERIEKNSLDESTIYKKLKKDTVRNIRRDRMWYLRVKKDGNYLKLIKEWNERPDVHEYKQFHGGKQRCDMCYIDDDNYAHHAVSEYRNLLKQFAPEV